MTVKTFEVLNDYENPEPPIELYVGDSVQLGEESGADDIYPNWVFATSDKTGRKAWIPKHILSLEKGKAVSMENYTSKELPVKKGERVMAFYELNGWYWCIREKGGERGWVAHDNVKNLGY